MIAGAAMAGWIAADAAVHGPCSLSAGTAGARVARSAATSANLAAAWFTLANATFLSLRSALMPLASGSYGSSCCSIAVKSFT
jgi:hypothetical protein